MEKIILKIKKRECTNTCPLPLELIPSIEKGIKKIQWDEKTSLAEIMYNKESLDKNRLIKKLKEAGYERVK